MVQVALVSAKHGYSRDTMGPMSISALIGVLAFSLGTCSIGIAYAVDPDEGFSAGEAIFPTLVGVGAGLLFAAISAAIVLRRDRSKWVRAPAPLTVAAGGIGIMLTQGPRPLMVGVLGFIGTVGAVLGLTWAVASRLRLRSNQERPPPTKAT